MGSRRSGSLDPIDVGINDSDENASYLLIAGSSFHAHLGFDKCHSCKTERASMKPTSTDLSPFHTD